MIIINFIRKKIRWILTTLIVGTVAAASYQTAVAPNSAIKVESVKVARGTLKETMTISGEIDAEERTTLRFQTSGRLAWVGVKEGDYVKKYQGVASLDQREVKKKLDKELTDYLSARWDLDQTKEDNKVIVNDKIKRIVDQSQFDLNNAVLDVEIQNLSIELSNLWTPIEGIVVKVGSPFAGVNVTPSQAEIEIINPKTVYFAAFADQAEIIKFNEGMKGKLTLDSYLDDPIEGEIQKVSFIPKTGETGTVYSLKFVFERDNSDYKYKIGMTGDLDFTTGFKDNVLYVPSKFVKTEGEKNYVNVMENGKKIKIYVETGMETDEHIEIKSGVAEGVTIYD